MKRGIVLDWEAADKITVDVLKEQRDYLEKELKLYRKGKQWMHEEDVRRSQEELIPALNVIIKYFGTE